MARQSAVERVKRSTPDGAVVVHAAGVRQRLPGRARILGRVRLRRQLAGTRLPRIIAVGHGLSPLMGLMSLMRRWAPRLVRSPPR
jgi:hypothetical protein